ncbi:hypothetical protein SOVF_189310 [Spinacia oleracea]|uniref:Zinc finger CCCH domain-containing protein 5 n=1 Tax=Spinacia oleracea TaxID=3562 RepID=A0A9R0JM58_SPIOL|nr:zinc finger CCCH domain-containing protein 5 [Spinacia oleracea]KNA05548.1 hypothetical protein SOVF_189310 [Spinacia oleracea]
MAVMEENQQKEVEREIDEKTINPDDSTMATMSRKEKRKAMKKMKRKQVRKEIAVKEREEEEARLNDPEEKMRLLRLEQEEAERMERERLEFEERERQFLQALEMEKKRREEEEEEQRKLEEEESQRKLVNNENANDADEDDDWEYIEDGPAEIIWKGNEIIVKKKKVRVPKKAPDILKEKQESERPISNPLAPQSEVFEDYKSAQDALESVAQQVPNFGTEQDKAHCPFHLKTGVCRFGARCSRVHFYPDKSCTILIKNMYNGPGLAWEQDEGLEHTEEEVERSFVDFYEDVHTEFLKFGELVNFKVCKNGSSHLRGNVYVHYKSLESAMLAYQSTNARYFAGKLLTCEFINITRWRVAICGEYMKSRLKTCSRGSACNFIHCFRNPGGDYEWADWDKPAPRYWLKDMAALFGYTGDSYTDEVSPRYHSRRSRSRSPHRRSFSDEDDGHRRSRGRRSPHREKRISQDYHCSKHRETDNAKVDGAKRSSRKRERERESSRQDSKSRKVEAVSATVESAEGCASDKYLEHKSRSRRKSAVESVHECHHEKVDKYDQEKSFYADKYHDKFNRHKDKCVVQKEADSLNFESHGDSQDSDEDGHHSRSKKDMRRMKDDADSSGSASDESRLVKVEKRQQKKRGKSSRLKNKTRVADIGCDRDSRETYEDRQHRHHDKSPRKMKNISESADGRDRLGKDDKRPQKKVRKCSMLMNQSGFTDTESDMDEDRHHRHSKQHSKNVGNDVASDDALDGDRLGRSEKSSRKSRSSRSKKESDLTDKKTNRERIDEEERHCGDRSAKHHIKEPSLSKADSKTHRRSGKADVGTFVTDDRCRSSRAYLAPNHHAEQENTGDRYRGTCDQTAKLVLSRFNDGDKRHDSSYRDSTSVRDHKRCDEEDTASGKLETSSVHVHTNCEGIGDEAEAELEKACRYAALKKLEEIRMHKDIQAANSREPIASLKNCTQENIFIGVLEKADSSKVDISDASIKRRRI